MIPFYQHQNPVRTPIQNANFMRNWDYVTTQMWLKTAENLVKNVLNPKSFRILVLMQSKFHTSYIHSFFFFFLSFILPVNQITNIQLPKHINLVLGESIYKVSMWHEHGYGKEADIEAVEGKREYRGLMNLRLPKNIKYTVLLLHEKLLQFDWLRAVVFQLNLKYLHVKITKLLRVVV